MKKILSLVFAAFALMTVGCNKDDDSSDSTNGGGSATSVVGTWNLHHDDDFETLVLDENGKYSLLASVFYKEEGSYSYAGNSLTLTPSKAWERDYVRDDVHGGPVLDGNGNFQFTEWEEVQPQESTKTYPARLIYNGDVLLIKTLEDHGDPYEVWAPYVNGNATHVSNINDIQGKWRWQNTRVILTVEGNEADIIITPWGERYKGTIRYEKGVIYMDNPTFYTTRYDDGEGGWEHMNDEDPENSDWRFPFGEYPYQPTFGQISMGFVVDGNVAYGGIANLLALFEKE